MKYSTNNRSPQNHFIDTLRTRPLDMTRIQVFSGILIIWAIILALIIANTPLYSFYNYLLEGIEFRIGFSEVEGDLKTEIRKTLLHWINDGLMVLFFFVIGLEIKREFLVGSFTSRRFAILPISAAIGGMIVPALIFWFINADTPSNLSGWAIPTATDIAFALAILSLFSKRISPGLKLLLTMIAVIDDLVAILIIAIFYSQDIHVAPLYAAAIALVILVILNRKGVSSVGPYALAGFLLWVFVLESGIHATIAGVVAALFIPLHGKNNPEYSPLKHLEHDLCIPVALVVVPLFAFANAGVPFSGMTWNDFFHPVTLGIILGLVVGKQIGIFSMIWLSIRTGLCEKPADTNWLQLYAISVLCGIGFTMSLFIGVLSYEDLNMQIAVRVGVLSGSFISAITGAMLLHRGLKKHKTSRAVTEKDFGSKAH